jgi:hypothetical protein
MVHDGNIPLVSMTLHGQLVLSKTRTIDLTLNTKSNVAHTPESIPQGHLQWNCPLLGRLVNSEVLLKFD